MQKDHYVPKFLRKRFRKHKNFFIYDKNSLKIEKKTPKQICWERGFTTFNKEDIPTGSDEIFFEKALSVWESDIAIIYNNLLYTKNLATLKREDLAEFVRFLVWLVLCNPAQRNFLKEAFKTYTLLQFRNLSAEKLTEISLKCFGLILPHNLIRQKLQDLADKAEITQADFLALILEVSDSLFSFVLANYSWELIDFHMLGQVLCTSDRPVVLATNELQSHVGFNTPNVHILFPLSPNLCLLGTNTGSNSRRILNPGLITKSGLVEMVRIQMWTKSHRYIIAPFETMLPPADSKIPTLKSSVVIDDNLVKMSSV